MASAPDQTAPFRERIVGLKAKLRARQGKKEFAKSCEAIETEIQSLENRIARIEAGGMDL